jgi:hypothetical protein
VLYDAFFKHQRKPKMSGLGELYYEGKEYEAQLEHLKPGVLSDELRTALGMNDSSPPPWLVNMQVRVLCVGGLAAACIGLGMHNRCLWNSLNSFAQRICRRYGVCAVHVQAALCCELCCLHTPHLSRVQVFATALQTQALESCWTRYSTPLL